MSVHYMPGGCLHSISSVSPWYPLVLCVPINGVHDPHSARLGYPSHLKIGTLTGLLPALNCSEKVFAMDILAESRLTFRQGHTDDTVQPSAMIPGTVPGSGKQDLVLIYAYSWI